MQQIFLGSCLGGLVGTLPGLICFLLREETFWSTKLLFVIVAGTGVLIGAIAGGTQAILREFEQSRQFSTRDRDRRSGRVHEKQTKPVGPEASS